jgi:hypothetical protein
MKSSFLLLLAASSLAFSAEPALTIYNGGYAVVRETLTLDLKAGINQVAFNGATAQLEPDSVILRDTAGKVDFRILEQSYRNDPVTQAMLLSLYEGKELFFVTREPQKPDRTVLGKVVRSGFIPGGEAVDPIVEVDGKLQFSLPGEPRFPSLADAGVLKPTLNWKLAAPAEARVAAEVAYISQGFAWQASYNIVSAEKGDLLDLVGWITMENHSGMGFAEAKIKLMAGEVQRTSVMPKAAAARGGAMLGDTAFAMTGAPVSEKSFDEFHLYTLANPTTLRDKETKQVEFVRATGVKSERRYVLESYGETGQPEKIQVWRQFRNSEANRLGIALPKGNLRFYSQDGDRQLEFTGENSIGHTPKDELVRIRTGNSFDLVGERRHVESTRDEANHRERHVFEVKLRNRKAEPVEIVVREKLTRQNWRIEGETLPYEKKNARQIEFKVPVAPGEEKVIRYTVHYTW